jgi:YidC/Oxa1 family membrane protein insertase
MIRRIISPEIRGLSKRANCILALLAGLICLVSAGWSSASYQELSNSVEDRILTTDLLPSHLVLDPYPFAGLASYFNNVGFLIVDDASVKELKEHQSYVLQDNEWLVIVGRFRVLLLQQAGIQLERTDPYLNATNLLELDKSPSIVVLEKSQLEQFAPELSKIRYYHLWKPLASLAFATERSLIFLNQYLLQNWILTLIAFSLAIKILLFPITQHTEAAQNKVDAIRLVLDPQLEEIKRRFDGETAHNKIMEAHKKLGVSPFFSLRPMLVTLIQFPILIATFNALGEMPQFQGVSFLWIEDLAYPDSLASLPTRLAILGSEISLLPFVMSTLTLASMLYVSGSVKKTSVIFMPLLFLILFYPFPAAMVLYWALVNFWQLLLKVLQGFFDPKAL